MDSLQIPVGIAFFFFNSSLGRMVVFYPGPAGATESLLSLETWDELVKRIRCSQASQPTWRLCWCATPAAREASNATSFRSMLATSWSDVSAGRWKGFDGGEEAWKEIDGFFADLRARSGETSAEAVDSRMSELAFTIIDARVEPYAVVPTLMFRLQITEGAGEQIHAIALRCQIQVEPGAALFFS